MNLSSPWLRRAAWCGLLTAACGLAACEAKEPAPRVPANNTVTLRGLVGRDVTAWGKVESTSQSKNSGHQFLKLVGSELSIICLKQDLANFTAGKPADLFRSRHIEITGRLERYNGRLQIKLTQPAQIKIVAPAAAGGLKPVELKQLGADRWMSPGGLVYRGRDPEGRTRVEHVLRHARDLPDRDGPHGVFDGGEELAFAVIDQAWKIAQEKRLPARRERDRSSLLVPMGRRIGYLGGRTGSRQRHPPLSRVFIVYETGTKNIITAFPR